MDEQFSSWPKKKQEIIEAAITVIAQEGFDRATTAKIARQAEVGEGTIYRHFSNKEELVSTAAQYTGYLVFGEARRNYRPENSIQSQYTRFIHDFLKAGRRYQLHHQFMEQYLNSPIGIAYRKRTIVEVMANPDLKPIFFPLNRILHMAIKQRVVKELPFPFLVALTIGPMSFILKHSAQGFMELDDTLITSVAVSCWDSIRKRNTE